MRIASFLIVAMVIFGSGCSNDQKSQRPLTIEEIKAKQGKEFLSIDEANKLARYDEKQFVLNGDFEDLGSSTNWHVVSTEVKENYIDVVMHSFKTEDFKAFGTVATPRDMLEIQLSDFADWQKEHGANKTLKVNAYLIYKQRINGKYEDVPVFKAEAIVKNGEGSISWKGN